MTNQFVILGLLMNRSLSGYDIKRHVERLCKHFFDTSFGTIYPLLKKMEQQGLLTKEGVIQEGKPNKYMYSITPAGRERFLADMKSDVSADIVKSDYLLRLFFGEFVQEDRLTEWLLQWKRETEELIAQLEHDASTYPMSAGQRLCNQIGIATYKGRLSALEQILQGRSANEGL